MARTLQRDLDRIAQQADTTTEEGLHYVLTGVGVHSISNVYRGVGFFNFDFWFQYFQPVYFARTTSKLPSTYKSYNQR
jgi:hypothetical protein